MFGNKNRDGRDKFLVALDNFDGEAFKKMLKKEVFMTEREMELFNHIARLDNLVRVLRRNIKVLVKHLGLEEDIAKFEDSDGRQIYEVIGYKKKCK